VSTRQIQGLPREEWDRTSVGALTESCSSENTTAPDDDTLAALTKMNKSGMSRLMVVEGDRLVGILALKDLLQFLALKVELEGDG
jgi:high-affinity K+ transport system ATPase subunit B